MEKSMSKEEVERIHAFKLPNFVPPYPLMINPHGETARAETYRWIETHLLLEIYKTQEELQKFFEADFPGLVLELYVDAGEKEVAWACKYFTWLFVIDDHLDDIRNFYSPEKSTIVIVELNVMLMWSFPDDAKLYKNFVEFLDDGDVAERTRVLDYLHSKLDMARLNPGTVYDTSSPQIPPLCKAFRDLWATLWEAMPANFMLRWGFLYQHEVLAGVREVRNRKQKVILSVDDYITHRRKSVAIESCMVIIEFLNKVNLPDEIFYCPEMQPLLDAVNDIVAWHNDLCSFKKEALKGDVHNLVIVVSHEEGCSYTEAGMKIHQMMLNKLVDLEKAIEDLKTATPPQHQDAISQYVHLARTFVSGGVNWFGNCKRYKMLNPTRVSLHLL